MFKKALWKLLVVFVVVAMVAACAPTPAPTAAPAAEPSKAEAPAAEPTKAEAPAAEPTKAEAPADAGPKVFSIAINTDIDTWDPHGNRTMPVAAVLDYMVEALVKTDKTGKVFPGLAKRWEVSADGLEMTFHLQEGVKFSDGTPFDAEAVKWNVERMNNPDVKTASKSPYNRIVSVEVIDPVTVKFVLDKYSAPLLQALASTNMAMLSPTSVPKDSEAFIALALNTPVGTGPYMLKEFVKGDHVLVTRNADYWGEQPYFDEVLFRIVPDPATRESLLLAGQVDMAIAPPVTDLPQLQANDKLTVLVEPINRLIFFQINNQAQYLNDVRVRQALNYAVDKDAIINNVLMGLGKPVVSPMPDSFFGWCDVGSPYTYDPEKAKALLKEAGVPEGYEVKFMAPTGRYPQDFQVGEAVAGYLGEVGLKATVETMDWPTYLSATGVPAAEATKDIWMMGWGSPYLHGSHTMMQFGSDQQPPNGFNNAYYVNPEVDAMIEAAASEPDQTKAAQIYCDLNKKIWADAPWIFMYQLSYAVAYRADLTGVNIHPSDRYQAIYIHPK